MGSRLIIFCWHNVEGTHNAPSPPGQGTAGMWRQLSLLARVGRIVPLEDALDAVSEGRPLPPRAVALTFDDGYRDNLDVAVPMLRRLGLPATFFLTPGILDRSASPWWETSAWMFANARPLQCEWAGVSIDTRTDAHRRSSFRSAMWQLKRRARVLREEGLGELAQLLEPAGAPPDTDALFLDWDGARRLSGAGFAIGSHTMTHPILGEESFEVQSQELSGARRVLSDRLAVGARLLAYPNGGPEDVNQDTERAARAAGHSHGLTTTAGVNRADTPPFAVRRVLATASHGLHVAGPLQRRASRLLRKTVGRIGRNREQAA